VLFTGVLALMPANSFARGGGQWRTLWGRWRPRGRVSWRVWRGGKQGCGAWIPRIDREWGPWYEASRRGGGGLHHWYRGNYGYFSPFDYGLDDYAGPYYDDSGSLDVQTESPEASMSLIASVQKELAQLGYYHGPIDGIAGLETERAVRWFQSIDHLPVTGQIDGATREALRIA
jgi:hypothetical protein